MLRNSELRAGKLIVFEGADRSGKTTQARLLHQSLPGSVLLRYPDRTTSLGHLLSSFLAGTVTLSPIVANLLLIASLWETVQDIRKYLDQGKIVIMDRYTASCNVYSSVRGMDEAQLSNLLSGMPQASVTFFLDIDPQQSSQRGDFGREIYDTIEYQTKVRQGFFNLPKDSCWITIDATQPVEVIHKNILEKIQLK